MASNSSKWFQIYKILFKKFQIAPNGSIWIDENRNWPWSPWFCSFIHWTCMYVSMKHCENREKLHREYLIGCWDVKLFVLKNIIITSVTSHYYYCHYCHNLSIWVVSQFELLSLAQLKFEFCHKLSFWVLWLIFFSSVINWIWVSSQIEF